MNNITGISAIHSQGISGVSGKAGTSGPVGAPYPKCAGTSGPISIIDFKDDLMKKYHMRFKIEVSSYNNLIPICKITDISGIEYQFKPNSVTHARKEVDEYISLLITTIRQEKINNLINEQKF
jgi:hypothetical protein